MSSLLLEANRTLIGAPKSKTIFHM